MTSGIGIPIGPDAVEDSGGESFDHIPRLHELVLNGGWPGVIYAQVLVRNLKLAKDRTERPGNLRPIRGASFYSIHGPRGVAQMALVGTGKPIPGAAPEAGARFFFTDAEVQRQTGLAVQFPIHFGDPEPPPPEPEDDGLPVLPEDLARALRAAAQPKRKNTHWTPERRQAQAAKMKTIQAKAHLARMAKKQALEAQENPDGEE